MAETALSLREREDIASDESRSDRDRVMAVTLILLPSWKGRVNVEQVREFLDWPRDRVLTAFRAIEELGFAHPPKEKP